MKALVLSGGGSKGSYQIGVWKALKKLHIKFDIVTGTSVGALNGALVVQKDFSKAIKLWKNINMKLLFGEDAINSTNTKDILRMYGSNFLKNGGMDTKTLESIIRKYLNKRKFYKSKVNFGLVTVNISNKKTLQLKKWEIPKEFLLDYLMASATCYPAFQTKDIDGNKYIDGGFSDNLPINLALDLGATSIIAVDLSAPGFKIKPKKKVDTIIIKPNNKLTNFLHFDAEGSKKNIKFGYNDTMKVFGKYIGNRYTFKKWKIDKYLNEYQEIFLYTFNLILDNDRLTKLFDLKLFSNNRFILKIAQDLGFLVGVDETKIYTFKKYNSILVKKIRNCEKNKKKIDLVLDLYQKMMNKDYKYLRVKGILSPKEFLYALYLYTLREV